MRNYSNNASLDPASPEQDRCREQGMNGRKRSQKAQRVLDAGYWILDTGGLTTDYTDKHG